MNNARIAEVFDQLADLLEFQGANMFRIRAYRNAARTIRDLGEQVTAILDDENRNLTDIDGIGKDLAEKCQTLVETGRLPQLDELQRQIPESVLALLRIPLDAWKRLSLRHRLHLVALGLGTVEDIRIRIDDVCFRLFRKLDTVADDIGVGFFQVLNW